MLFSPHLWSIWFQLHFPDQKELFWCSLLTNIAAFSVLVGWLISGLFVAIFPLAHVSLLSVCRKRGAVLNISSASGMYPVPLLTIYSASKVIAIQRSWPFPHLLNCSVIIRHIPPACLLHAAVESFLFAFPGTLLSAACLISPPPASPPRMWTCVQCTSSHCQCFQHSSWSGLQEWCWNLFWEVGWPSGLLTLRWQKLSHWAPVSLSLGKICDCPIGILDLSPPLLLWHVFALPVFPSLRQSVTRTQKASETKN